MQQSGKEASPHPSRVRFSCAVVPGPSGPCISHAGGARGGCWYLL